MTVATYTAPNNTTQDPATYKANIDGGMSVLAAVAQQFAPHAATSPNMTVKVDAGSLMVAGALVTQAQQTSGTITAPIGNPRIDRVVIDAVTGAISVITGTPAGSPTPPALTAGKLPIAQVLVQTSSTSITNTMITDERTNGGNFAAAGVATASRLSATSGAILVGTGTALVENGTINALLDISGASGGQVKFPASRNASSNANTLDDYEEGTFTPTVKFGGASTGITYSLQSGIYTKIGRLVVCEWRVALSSKGSSTGSATLEGLPFTSLNISTQSKGALDWASMTSSLYSGFGSVNPNSTNCNLFAQTAAATGSSALTDTQFGNSTQIMSGNSYNAA